MKRMTIRWTGPYGMPRHEGGLPPPPDHPGVYLYTVKCRGGFLVCSPGITQRTIRQRMSEHVRGFLKGDYNILDADALKRRKRVEVWQGWDPTAEKRAQFERRRDELAPAIDKLLCAYRIFATDATEDLRLLARIEASIMGALYALPRPHRDIFDERMHRSARRADEPPILAVHKCDSVLMGLPGELVM